MNHLTNFLLPNFRKSNCLVHSMAGTTGSTTEIDIKRLRDQEEQHHRPALLADAPVTFGGKSHRRIASPAERTRRPSDETARLRMVSACSRQHKTSLPVSTCQTRTVLSWLPERTWR